MSKTTTAKQLREKYGVKPSDELAARVKEQRRISSGVAGTMSDGPKTIPEIAQRLGMSLPSTTWYVLTLTRHKRLRAVDKTGEGYWRYEVQPKEDD